MTATPRSTPWRYFKRDDIPFQWALADAFTICDGYHCSVLGPTWPNRLYLMTGQIDPAGANGGPTYGNYVPTEGFSWQTYPELLSAAGVSWKVYQEVDNYGFNVLEYFDQYQNASTSSPLYQNAMKFYQPGQFEYDAINDRLPTVSYILPTSYQSEHPDFMPAAGADYVASKVDAIAANPDVWAKTVFILIYDENDGYFDHVVPPTAPAGTAGEYITASASAEKSAPGPIGLGFRVPCIIVSPWTVGGYVCHDTFDHTSVTRLLEQVTGVVNPNITAWRRADRRRLHLRARHDPVRPVPAAAGHQGAARAGRAGSGPVPAPALSRARARPRPSSRPGTSRCAAAVRRLEP